MRWFKFILSHSIFISFCAVALCYQAYTLLLLKPDPNYYGFVFFSTLCSYNFYWSVSKYSFSRSLSLRAFGKKNASYLLFFIFAGLILFYYLFYLKIYFTFIAGGVLLTLLYSLPLWPFKFVLITQKAGFLKPILLAATWAYVTALVPAVPVLETQIIPVLVLTITRFFFMLLLCIIFDMRDIEIDKIHNLHTLATDVPRKTLQVIIHVVFVFFLLGGIFIRIYFREGGQLISFLLTGIIVYTLYRLSLKPRGYLFYYFLIDGVMLISSAATYIAAI